MNFLYEKRQVAKAELSKLEQSLQEVRETRNKELSERRQQTKVRNVMKTTTKLGNEAKDRSGPAQVLKRL